MGIDRADGSHWFYSYLPQGIAGGATSALIPLFAYALGGSLADIGIIAAATSIASVPAFMMWGSLSDALGRRKIFLLIGFLGSGLCFLVMASSRTISEFYLANLLFGFLGAASGPAGTVLIIETSERKEWPSRLALLSRIVAVGWTVGLALGVAWLAVGPGLLGAELGAMRILFVIGAGLGLLSGIFAAAWAFEPAVRVNRRDIRLVDINPRVDRGRFLPMRALHYFDPRNHRDRRARLPRPLRAYLVCVFLLFGGFTAFYSFFPIYLKEEYRFGSPEIFALYIASQVMSVATYPYVGRWIARRGSRPIQIYASVGRSVLFSSFFVTGFFVLPVPALLAVGLALHAFVGLCWAAINVAGSTLVSGLAPETARSQTLGAFNAVQGFGSILGPLVGGFSAQWLGYGPAFAVSAGFILSGSALLAALRLDERGRFEKGK